MAKLKTKSNQPVVDEEGLLDHIAQDGNTTQIGGDLEVDGTILNLLDKITTTIPQVFVTTGSFTPNSYQKRILGYIANSMFLKYNEERYTILYINNTNNYLDVIYGGYQDGELGVLCSLSWNKDSDNVSIVTKEI